MGIRLALGARPADLVALVLRQGLRLSLAGVAAGLAAAAILTRFLESQLYGTRAGDPVPFAVAAASLLAVALLASGLPARRAARVDPIAALRSE
jgi:ABC-type antimicrobial peptide transport system permease subunit